jgi:hypothetical protein
MVSLSSPTTPEPVLQPDGQPAAAEKKPSQQTVTVAGFGDFVAPDFAGYLAQHGWEKPTGVAIGKLMGGAIGGTYQVFCMAGRHQTGLVLFLGSRLSALARAFIDGVAHSETRPLVCIISSFRATLGDPAALEVENHARGLFKEVPTIVFRTGHIVSRLSPTNIFLRRFGACWPLVPRRLRSCFIESDELFAAIEAERADPHPGRTYTLLGSNQAWQDMLARHRSRGILSLVLTFLSGLLALLLVGQLAALVLSLLARRQPALRALNFDTLRPDSFRELLSLYNPYNYRHVKVVGYNNGVVHFGQRFPGRTIVSTVGCDRVARAGTELIKADCGATIRKAMDFLAGSGRELPVIPNYSYVALGTAFFVPIHGSASAFSTVADTIVKVILYDPLADRLVVATRDEPAFREHLYDLKSPVLLLRLYLCVKPAARYRVQREELDGPDSATLLAALRDRRAANVEVRKAQAAGKRVTIDRYYQDGGPTPAAGLELRRDRLGRLWDRLEENPITSFLMHALTRHLAWHVELFFTAEEFARFWATHRALPLQKIQLRYIRRDGMPKSPFCDHDCVSSDMFMLRRHRRKFEAYLAQTFAVIRANPGKHSG